MNSTNNEYDFFNGQSTEILGISVHTVESASRLVDGWGELYFSVFIG